MADGINTWPAHQVEMRSIDKLVLLDGARTHSEKQLGQIANSMREFGWTIPVLIDEGGAVLAGKARILAARSLGYDEAPCVVALGWTEAQKRAYVIADNKLAANAGWDEEALAAELSALMDLGFDMDLLGFDQTDLDALFGETPFEGQTDPDDAPPAPEVPVARPGDVWVCGAHRVRCGDSTSADDVEALLAGSEPLLMVTDPPYGVNYDPEWRNRAARTSPGMGNRCIGAGAVGEVLNDDRADWREAYALFPGDVAYIWHGALHCAVFAESLVAAGFELRSQIIWAKDHFGISRGHYHWQHEACWHADRGDDGEEEPAPDPASLQAEAAEDDCEPAWYAVRRGGKGHWRGGRKQSTLWHIPKPAASETGHSTQKPVECMRRPIVNNLELGGGVYDPFLGSGTTLVAAEMERRVAFGMELNPAYVDVSVRRWQDFTGGEAVLEGDGRSFADIAAERGEKPRRKTRRGGKSKAPAEA